MAIIDWDDAAFIIAGSMLATFVNLNDFDPPEPPQTPDQQTSQAFLGTVYSRTIFNNVGRVKEAYFPDQASCQRFVTSNLKESSGITDVNAWDSGKCYPTASQGEKDPQVATIFSRNFLGTFQFNQNLKVRYFNSPESCAFYIGDYLRQMAGFVDVNMWDSATCHSTVTGKRTAFAENSLFNGVSIKVENRAPSQSPSKVSYIGTTYLRNIFGNLSRENVTYHQSQESCERYAADFLQEADNSFDFNAADSAVCMQMSGSGPTIKVDNTWGRGVTYTVAP